MSNKTIKVNNESLRIRPSAVDTFYGCAWQWAKSHIEGISSIPNSRAAIGTAIHKGIEVSWNQAISSGKVDHNLSMMTDAAVAEFEEETKEGVGYGSGETKGSCIQEVIKGTEAWIEDISGFLTPPTATEKFFTIPMNHSMVAEIGGTIDYIEEKAGIIDDVKTSKRTVSPAGYVTQQSIYKLLAEENGVPINYQRLQNVVLTKQPKGAIVTMEPDVEHAKVLVNGILDVLDVFHEDKVPAHLLFRGNPKYMFCSDKFCAHHATCPWVRGEVPVARKADIAAIKL